ncbi:hypothetical protein DAEQUDRAFT_758259 [Daedalea quercina L-15889]|uniref:WD40 repeat-like protein n=1 Tax=Daedalea quercina L-15889 TaxID=1314783 RepID=A0A165NQP5_9APHY|nr:hypothetical protein DAEQUDRAFT_758259 [Daedalea quercina L-15889]
MPKELPGLYWDEEKNRYFPLSMKPKPLVGHVSPRASRPSETSRLSPMEDGSSGPSRKRRRIEGGTPTIAALEKLRSSSGTSPRKGRVLHDIFASSLSLTCGGAAYPVAHPGHITSICAVDKLDSVYDSCSVMVGDNKGWLYSLLHNDDPNDAVNRQPELNIGSSVSAICAWGTRRVAASFGWPCKIFIRDIQPVERWTILSMPDVVCYDVVSADLQDRKLALGGGGRGILVPDIDVGTALQVLPTDSDVLTIALDNHLLYMGLRNGFITRFDTRLSTKNCETIFNQRFRRSSNSVTHVSLIHENSLLVSTVRGDLETHDLRFMREAEPLLKLSGHVNSSAICLKETRTQKSLSPQGLAVDPAVDFVFAAGQDRRIRGWSLRTGKRIPAEPISSRAAISHWHEAPSEQTRLFDVLFDEPVVAMQVTTSDTGPCLWAASGGDLYRTPLGNVDVVA